MRFSTVGPMDFNSYRYVIVFNTTGNGQEPYANAFQTGFQNYSYAWVVGAQGGVVPNPPVLIQYYLLPGSSSGLGQRTIVVPPQFAQLTTNIDGNNSAFQLLFARSLLNQPNPTSPSPGPTTAATPTPTAAGPTPTGATPAPSPSTQPTTPAQANWTINFITTDTNGIPLDAGGPNGKSDNSFVLTVNTTQSVDLASDPLRKTGSIAVTPQAAWISTNCEIINSP